MRKFIIVLLFTISSSAFAGPRESVDQTIGQLLEILKDGNEHSKTAKLCSLVRHRVDTSTIGSELLGSFFGKLGRDRNGIARFKALVPSIIFDQFYGLLNGKGGRSYVVTDTVPKGSSRVGVRVIIGGKTRLTITVSKTSLRVLDVEYGGRSMIRTKQAEIAAELRRYYKVNEATSLPISRLVDQLVRKGITRCN